MIVSHALRCVFVHIQKTGGSSIDRALREADPTVAANRYGGRRHIPAREFRAIVGEPAWRGYFKFAFVRNPWDRLVSWHRMCLDVGDNAFQRHIRARYPAFRDFALHATTGPAAKVAVNQLDFLVDEAGAQIVDFVGRFERFADDYAAIAGRLGLDPRPPHENRTAHDDYRTYYDDETRAAVGTRFRRDIERFGYAF